MYVLLSLSSICEFGLLRGIKRGNQRLIVTCFNSKYGNYFDVLVPRSISNKMVVA